jgi:4,5-dihydroxyphthalate decarboxylase
MTEIITLSTMLGTYPKTAPLKEGKITSPLVKLDIADVDTAQKAFKDVVRKLKYDVAELAIVTFLQAYDAGKPYVLLPFVMNGMFHHKSIYCRADSDLKPQDLAGKRVAMRAYSQTTPTWVRGILCDEYGMRLNEVRWLSQEEAHVEGYQEPEWVTRIESGLSLEGLLMAGEVDAIIAGSGLSGKPELRPLIPSPAEAALAWHEKTHAIPINHMVAVRKELAESRGDLVREIFQMLCASRAAGAPPQTNGPDLQPTGFDKIKDSLEMAIRFAYAQKLIGKKYSVEELYGNVLNVLD